MRISSNQLERWSKELLKAAGFSDEAARIMAESLVEANLRGVDSHGVLRMAIYTRRVQAGLLNPNPKPRIIKQEGAVALVDADQGPGQVAGVYAMDLAVELARQHGVGAVGIRRSAHYGAAAYYVMRAARRGYPALSATNVEPDVVPYGGAQPALGTNPLAFAAPAPQGVFVLDMATSQVAMGKVFIAREKGTLIPEDWAVDKEGKPTTNPHDAIAVVPLGGPKGYALAIFVEVICGVFTGAGITWSIGRMYDNWERSQDVGSFFLALDPERTVGREDFMERMGQLWQGLKSVPPALGFDEVIIPGELEERIRQERLEKGIPLQESVYEELLALSEKLGVALPA